MRISDWSSDVCSSDLLEQYRAWNDNDPPPGWKGATPPDIWMAFGRETPDVLFLSAPCKGFSGLLASIHAATDKYQALNGLTLRGIWLPLQAYKASPIDRKSTRLNSSH